MGSILSVAWEAIWSPVTTLMLLGVIWIWVKLFLQEWDPRQFSLSYGDCIQRNQYWRILLAPLSHNSFWMLLLNASVMWNFRNIEQAHGSFFFLRYSALLLVSEALITFTMIYYSMRIANSVGVGQMLSTLNTMGSSGFILAWLSFESLSFSEETTPKNFVLLGWFNLHPVTAPIVMVAIYYFCLPGTHAYSNLSGLLSGYLLAGGVLKLLPGWYWSTCFLLDIALIAIASAVFRDSSSAVSLYTGGEESTVLEVVEMGGTSDVTSDRARTSNNDLRDLLQSDTSTSPTSELLQRSDESRMEEGNADDEFTPLLSENTTASASARNRVPSSTAGGNLSHLLEPSGPSSGNSRIQGNSFSARRAGSFGNLGGGVDEEDSV